MQVPIILFVIYQQRKSTGVLRLIRQLRCSCNGEFLSVAGQLISGSYAQGHTRSRAAAGACVGAVLSFGAVVRYCYLH